MACRSLERAEPARRRLLGELPSAIITLLPLDLSEPGSIRDFCGLFVERVAQLDVLINNAGIFGVPFSRNSVGHELQIATNYLGAFALTGTLLPSFGDRPRTRIVNVGSLSHRFGRLPVDRLDMTEADYTPFRAYAQSKVALISHTLELNRRLRARQSPILALGAHPGFAATEGSKNYARARSSNALARWLKERAERVTPTARAAAEPIIHAACAEGVSGGEYFGPGGFLEIAGPPSKARINPRALDEPLSRRLWSVSEDLTGVAYLSG
jgi:NAD(P)-dependent dehydrogenase (short-subunit alcohol dehydrogenase family)